MNPVIAISRLEFKKIPGSESKLADFSLKVKEIKNYNIYISPTNIQLMEFICYLKDADIHFDFYSSEEELSELFGKSPKKIGKQKDTHSE
jgi:hypothetical protein